MKKINIFGNHNIYKHHVLLMMNKTSQGWQTTCKNDNHLQFSNKVHLIQAFSLLEHSKQNQSSCVITFDTQMKLLSYK